MASIQPHGTGYRVQVYVAGKRESKVFATKKAAAGWALSREAELTGKALPDRSMSEAMDRYAREVAPGRDGGHWEVVRLKALARHPIARRKLANLAGADLADWRDERLKHVKPATVAREMTLLRGVFEIARRDWQWIRANPLTDVRWPQEPKGRARRVQPDEIAAVVKAFGVETLAGETATQRVGLAFLLAIETAMRSGEMLSLLPGDLHLSARFVRLRKTKNGDQRDVALTSRAVEIIKALPKTDGPIFQLDPKMRDALWRKYRPKAIKDLHFHDTRSEAIWRLSKKFDVLQLARNIGHRDINSLMIYYNESAADLALRLD